MVTHASGNSNPGVTSKCVKHDWCHAVKTAWHQSFPRFSTPSFLRCRAYMSSPGSGGSWWFEPPWFPYFYSWIGSSALLKEILLPKGRFFYKKVSQNFGRRFVGFAKRSLGPVKGTEKTAKNTLSDYPADFHSHRLIYFRCQKYLLSFLC